MSDESAPWGDLGTLERFARAGSREIRTILLQDAPLWVLIAKAIETRRHEGYMGAPHIQMASGFTFGPEEIQALAAAPDRWTEPHPLRVPP